MENKAETKRSAADEDDSNCIFCPGKDLELISVKYIMKINGSSIEELKPKDRSIENTKCDDKYVLEMVERTIDQNLGIRTPIFKSPVTSNVVNLKLKFSTPAKKQIEPKKENDDFRLVEGVENVENVFFDENYAINKYRRKSSVIAESKIKKLLEEDKKADNKEDLFVKTSFESIFCGISKSKKPSFKTEEDSFISNVLKGSCLEGGIRVLQDKTNSPRKFDGADKKHDIGVKPQLNTKFFVEECLLEENQPLEKVKKEDNEYIAPNLSKGYLKLKDINTKYNEGYKTIEIKKKVIIDLVTCPKMFFRKSSRSRMVYFDTEAQHNTHNINGIIKPIITQISADTTNFEWEGEKETVEVVQRIDLGSDISTEEFVFKRLGNQIES
ncbi:hypothetical protein GINT2_000125 [Glugoides intestinalis]